MAKTPTRVKSLARSHTDRAIAVLVEIMNDRSAGAHARVEAAKVLIAYGLGSIVNKDKFVLCDEGYYVYSVHKDGQLIYVGKGSGRRHEASARKLSGNSRVRAQFGSEIAALDFERRLIKRFKPIHNIVHIGTAN